jgi:uncharacterized protein (DUF1501 family)
MLTRRLFLGSSLGSLAASALPLRLAFASAPGERRLVLVILRGGLDGLSALPPIGDDDFKRQRGELALAKSEVLPLDGFFGLHPALASFAELYAQGQLLPLHAVASPYRDRSHFDAQDLLENGGAAPRQQGDGWLGRTLAALGGSWSGLGVGQDLPLVLQGSSRTTTWAPSALPGADTAFLARVADLYAADPLLGPALQQGLQANALAGEVLGNSAMGGKGGGKRAEAAMAEGAGRLIAAEDGPRIAVLELGGWDTHANQGTTKGRLTLALGGLDAALAALQRGLGPAWQETAVVVVTEFGRTVAPNGTGGTDHGTGAAAFLAGGRVAGGRVLADWPGLSKNALYEGRDLKPTLDLRAVFKGLLAEQFALSSRTLESEVFPDSAGAPPLPALLA